MSSLEFHTQLTSGQNNNKHRLSPEFIKPKFTNPTRDSHTHTAGSSQHSQHTQPKLLTPLQRTHQIGQLRKNPQKISFRRKSPFNRWTMTRDGNRRLCSTEIGASARQKSAPLLDENWRVCSPKIGASARRKSAPLLGRPTFLRSPSLRFFSFLLRRTLSGEVGDMRDWKRGIADEKWASEREAEVGRWWDKEKKYII